MAQPANKQGKKVRFIRVRGKVVPIRDDNYNGGLDAGHPGARDYRNRAKESRQTAKRGETFTRAAALGGAAAYGLGKRGLAFKAMALAGIGALGTLHERVHAKNLSNKARRLDRAGARASMASGNTGVGTR